MFPLRNLLTISHQISSSKHCPEKGKRIQKIIITIIKHKRKNHRASLHIVSSSLARLQTQTSVSMIMVSKCNLANVQKTSSGHSKFSFGPLIAFLFFC